MLKMIHNILDDMNMQDLTSIGEHTIISRFRVYIKFVDTKTD